LPKPEIEEERPIERSIRTRDEETNNTMSNTIVTNLGIDFEAFQACLHFIITTIYASLHIGPDNGEEHVVLQVNFLFSMVEAWKNTIRSYLYRLHACKEFSLKLGTPSLSVKSCFADLTLEGLKTRNVSTELKLTTLFDFVSNKHHNPSNSYLTPLAKLVLEFGKLFHRLYKFIDLLGTIVNPQAYLALVEESRDALDQASYFYVHSAARLNKGFNIRGRARRTVTIVGEGVKKEELAASCCQALEAPMDVGGMEPWKLLVDGLDPNTLSTTPAVRKTVKRVLKKMRLVLELNKELFGLVADALDDAKPLQALWAKWNQALARSQTELDTQSSQSAADAMTS
jgi:hypothetical protein